MMYVCVCYQRQWSTPHSYRLMRICESRVGKKMASCCIARDNSPHARLLGVRHYSSTTELIRIILLQTRYAPLNIMPSYRNMALSMFLLSLKNTGTLGFGLQRTSSSIATSARRTISNTSPLYSTAAVEATADEKKKETSSNIPIKNEQAYSKVKMDDIVSLCKRRGIIFPSSEIYNGFAGFFDYGPLGSELKRNVKDAFWTNFVQCREDVVGIDSSIIHNPTTWQSSGHLDGFSDPMVDCKETKLRYRADQLFCAPVVLEEDDSTVGYVCVMEANDDDMKKAAKTQAKKLLREQDKKGQKIKSFDFVDLTQIDEETMAKVPSPGSGTPTLTMPRDFNLMFQTQVGAQTDASSLAYLRPETAQGIFINYKNVRRYDI